MSIIFSTITFDGSCESPTTYLVSGHPRTAEEVFKMTQYAEYCKGLINPEAKIATTIQYHRFGLSAQEMNADADHLLLIQAFDAFADDIGDDFTNQDGVEWLDFLSFTIQGKE